MRKRYLLFFLLITILIGTILRVYKIDQIPPGINRDEGSIAYTAYSLIKTGKDEYGKIFPLSFESFGDWKLPFYIYGTTGFIWLFGMSEFSVRLLSILAGIGGVILTYFFIKQIFKNEILAILTSFLVAVSPWHLHLSRVESESNTAVTLTIIAVIFFIKSIYARPWFFVLSALFFALTYFTYAGNNIFTTLLLISIVILYRNLIPKNKWTIIGGGVFFLLFGIITYNTLFNASATKIGGISIFSSSSIVHSQIEIPRNEHSDVQSIFSRIVHNKPLFALERFLQNYLNAFSPDFLFIKGGTNNAHNIENMGNMYLIEAIFFYFGVFFLLFKRKKSKEEMLVIIWLLISPIAASITRDAPHTNRMFAVFPILPLITSIGIYQGFQVIRNKVFQKIAIVVFSFIFLLNILIYLDRYFVHFPRNEVKNWGFGYKFLNTTLQQETFRTKKVIMSHPEYSHYIYLLFYQKYDPLKYQKEAIRYSYTEDKFLHVRKYDRFEFRQIDWKKDTKMQNALLIAFPQEIPLSVKKQFRSFDITLPDGKTMFTVIETQ